MALTKPRAYQIFDIDYKQATRVCTVANVTLSGGTPNQVDGVNLSLNDRILVTGQTNNVQNGIYYVTTVGTGANGTWARSVDGDVTGELQSGMIIMVTEGTSYGDTQWKLITNDPITLGVTGLVFTLNYGVPYTVASSPPTTGNVVSAQWLDSSSGALYEYSYDGSSYYWVDITGPTVSNTSSLTGIVNGNSNIKINTANSNITMGVIGVPNVVVISNQSLNVTGNLSTTNQYQVAGKQAVNGPAFRAYIAVGQTILSNGSQQKVTFGTETFDTNSNFASSTFTPTVEGYYQLNATVRISGGSGTGECMIVLYKNGTEYSRGTNESGTEQGVSFYSMQVSDIAYANGTGDYFEVYIQQSSGASKDTTAGPQISYFSGCMLRGA